jgi:MFS family permease
MLKLAGRAFGSRNYRLYFLGQCGSLIGTWIQHVAMSWLAYRLTGSPFLLSLVTFAGQIPVFFFASFAGVIVDRVDRRMLLITTQVLSCLHAGLLAFLTLSGLIQVWHLVALGLFFGTVNAFDAPTRHSLVGELVEEKKDLGNAVALNAAMFNGARLVGPSIGGLLIGALGEGICFLLNGISFLAIIFTLLAMRMPKRKKEIEPRAIFHQLKEGYRYILGLPPVLYLLILMGLIGFMGMPFMMLLPVFAKDILHGGPQTFGFLMSASAAGSFIGALSLASRSSLLGLGRLNVIATIAFGAGIIVFSFSRSMVLSMSILFFTGLSMIVHAASSQTMLQTIVDEDKQGRVMGCVGMVTMGMTPFGSLLAGFFASRLGAPNALIINGVFCIGAALFFYSRRSIIKETTRPIYVKMGIVKDRPL